MRQPDGSRNPFETATAIQKGLLELSLLWERVLPEQAQLAYLKHLRDLTQEQIALAFDRAAKECEFWPVPAVLRRLAGVETESGSSERQAREGLQWVLWRIRKHGTAGRPARGATIREATREHQAVYESIPCPTTPEPIRTTLEELGAGDVQAGVTLMAMHPLLERDPDAYDNLSFRLSATEKLEQRWLEAWRRANRGKR